MLFESGAHGLLFFFFKFCRRKILSPHFSPPLERKGGVDQSTASFTEPMRPSTSHSSVLTTRAMQRQSSGTGLGRSRETEEEENPSDDEVSETLDNNNKNCTCMQTAGVWGCHDKVLGLYIKLQSS